jgi:hypothetical protein
MSIEDNYMKIGIGVKVKKQHILNIPPSLPKEGTKWVREDKVVFIYNGKEWVRHES